MIQQVDPTFRLNVEQYAQVYDLQPLADSSCLILGTQVYTNGVVTGNLVRVRANSQVEQSVQQQLAQIDLSASGSLSFIPKMLRYPDGRLLLAAGDNIRVTGSPQINSRVIRLLPDGQVDPSFSLALLGSSLPLLRTAALQADGKILLGGLAGLAGLPVLVRLNADGSYDTSFAPAIGSGRSNDVVESLAVQPDGRILVGGLFSRPASSLLRLLPDGQLDPSFQAGITNNTSVQALLVRPTGQIIVGANASLLLQGRKAGIQQLFSGGQIDASFQAPAAYGTATDMAVNRLIELLPDGRLIVLAAQPDGSTAPIRLLPNGQLDASYRVPSRWSLNPKGIAVDAAGKLLVYGQYNHRSGLRGPLQRLHPSGQPDEKYAPQLSKPGSVDKMTRLPDGRTILAGAFDQVGGVRAGNLACLLPNDEVDTAFVRRSPVPTGYIERILVQPSGKILLGGGFEVKARQSWLCLARLQPNGALDTTFQRPAGYNVQGLALQHDGRIIIGGDLARFYTGRVFARLSVDGAIDKTFQIPVALSDGLSNGRRVVAQPDDKLILAGSKLYRVLPDGQHDPTFQADDYNTSSSPLVRDMVLLPNGKLLVGGQTPTPMPGQYGTIARYLPNGKLDVTFEDILSYRMGARALLPRPGGGVWVGGVYHPWGVSNSVSLMCLDEKGQTDPTFMPIFGYGNVGACSQTTGGKILVGGTFVHAVTPTMHYLSLVRLTTESTPLALTQGNKSSLIEVYPNPNQGQFTVKWPATQSVSHVQLSTVLGRPLQQYAVKAGTISLELSTAQLPGGMYLLQVDSAQGRTIHRVVVE